MALHLIPGIGNIAYKNLLSAFGSPENILQAPFKELREVEGVREEVIRGIVGKKFATDPEGLLKKIDDWGIRILTFTDPTYPPLLKTIHDPPMILYCKGRNIPPKLTFVAIVGSRNPSSYGLKSAENVSKGIAGRGLGVVSGMARGIDAAAHWGCLNKEGFTVAVLGTGLDVIYPASNKRLFDQITQQGAVISEFPPGTPPEPKNFPIRNRIISGLSRGVVVVEAAKRSGSLITASLALEQGREVFAVPGSIYSFKSVGCHFLLKQGAGLVENVEDILEGLGLNHLCVTETDISRNSELPEMDDSERAVFEAVGDYPIHIDHIAQETRLTQAQVSSILMRMELKGIVRQLHGKMFVR